MSKFKLRQAALISWSVALVGSVLIMISPLLGSEARFPALGGGVGLLVVGAVIYGSHGLLQCRARSTREPEHEDEV